MDLNQPVKTALLLPSILPDVAWLEAYLLADEVLLLDTELFSRKSRVHRGKIRTPDSTQWIHIPIHPGDKKKPLSECRIDHSVDWFTPLWRSIEFNYRNSVYFDFFEPEIKNNFLNLKRYDQFLDASEYFAAQLFKYLEIESISGKRNISDPKIQRVSDVHGIHKMHDLMGMEEFNSSTRTIILEFESKNYLPQIMESDQLYKFPHYRQHFGGFEPNCCLIDLLFEVGPDAWTILDKLKVSS